jgi:hypothetical protein
MSFLLTTRNVCPGIHIVLLPVVAPPGGTRGAHSPNPVGRPVCECDDGSVFTETSRRKS